MGTLTAGQPRLAEYCEHKLPTSCRLTSIPQCCACADERAHAPSYSTYIDGIGFVPRGTRWQRYCWFCKEFWETRVRASGLRPPQSRIPEVPDQAAFLKRWYEFHRGYRIVTREDGSEERIAVLGEDFREVSPGYLPRTLEELRAGRAANEMEDQAQQRQFLQAQNQDQTDEGPSLDDTLDAMFLAASLEEGESQQQISEGQTTNDAAIDGERSTHVAASGPRQSPEIGEGQQDGRNNIHAQVMTAASPLSRDYHAERITQVRWELDRMRNSLDRFVSGLRDLGEDVPEHSEATGRLSDLDRALNTMDDRPAHEIAEHALDVSNRRAYNPTASDSESTMADMQARVEDARNYLNAASYVREQAASELDSAERELRAYRQRLQQVRRDQRTAENYRRLFGTREEMLAQGDQYESPIGGMFTRAYERFHAAEEVRREERTLRGVLEDEARAGGEEAAARLLELEVQERDVWGVPRPTDQQPIRANQLADFERDLPLEPRGELEEYYDLIRRQDREQRALRSEALERTVAEGASPRNSLISRNDHSPPDVPNVTGLDEGGDSTDQQDTPLDPATTQQEELGEHGVEDLALVRPEHERHADMTHILLHLVQDNELMTENLMTPDYIYSILTRLTNNTLSTNDERELSDMLERPRIAWRSGLMAARFLRRRREGTQIRLIPNVPQDDFQRTAENTEVMAEAFQMSAELRRRAPGLTAPDQLRMLHRLQVGERRMEDVAKLAEMLRDDETFALASRIHAQTTSADTSPRDAQRRDQLEDERRAAAHHGDHSRRELNAQRDATRAFAIAAGRTAMRAGPSTLLEQLSRSDEETRAAYERLQQNGFVPEGDGPGERLLRQTAYRPLTSGSLSASDDQDSDEEDEGRGLDAKDTGRPEPRADEELQVSMECRICYTQLAEIACLPCGHLVMCKWCSDQHSPGMAHDRTRPRRATGCPVCRKGIRQKVRVYRP